ncbi:MAG: tripartite tricarboxylate transporter substrate binding protein [Burkholderiales bacterium]|nr:tripartite tricarboxylate transporter substrate binding protein [Burkholderiales bacterium]
MSRDRVTLPAFFARHRADRRAGIAMGRALFSALCIAALLAGPAPAGGYPVRPVRMLIPQPAGGTMDTIARALADPMARSLGQNIIIDNRSGANGIIAGETLARAAPDGYTLLYTSASLVNNELVQKKKPFETLRDFAPVTLVNRLPGYLVLVHPQLAAQNMRELVELSKDPRRRVLFGSSGVGNSQHLLGELINARSGAKLAHVPYKGFALIMNALMGNEIQVAFGSPTTVMGHIKAGRVRAIAYTADRRWAVMPDVPTVSESGIPGLVYQASWHGIFAPAATPRAIVLRVQGEVAKAVELPRIRELMDSGGHVTVAGSPGEFREFLKTYLGETGEQLRAAGITPQ